MEARTPIDKLVYELTHQPWATLSIGPETGRMRAMPTVPTDRDRAAGTDGFPFSLMFRPPWHPMDLILATRGWPCRLPDRKMPPKQLGNWHVYTRIVSEVTGWPLFTVQRMYHLLTEVPELTAMETPEVQLRYHADRGHLYSRILQEQDHARL